MPVAPVLRAGSSIGSSLATDGGDRKDEIPYSVFLIDTTALAQEQAGFGLYST